MEGVPLSHHCQVLMVLAECDEPVDIHYLRQQLSGNLSKQQVSSALHWLVSLGKAKKLGHKQGNQAQCNLYEFNEEYDGEHKRACELGVKPLAQKRHRRRTDQRGNDKKKFYEKRLKAAALPHVKYREQKVALLIRLEKKVSETDRDLLLGIIQDYKI